MVPSQQSTQIPSGLSLNDVCLNAEPIPQKAQDNPFAVNRPHASQDMLFRQGSFRGFQKLNETSPFKRQLSLRLNDLPSTIQRQYDLKHNGGISNGGGPCKCLPHTFMF